MHIYMFIVHIFWIGMGNYTSLTIQSTFSITCTLGCTTLATGYILSQTENANKRDFLGLFLTWPAFCIKCPFVTLKRGQNISSGQKGGLIIFWNYVTPKCTHGMKTIELPCLTLIIGTQKIHFLLFQNSTGGL